MLLPDSIAPTEYQQKVLAFRRVANIFEGGGRGGGKSTCLALDTIAHCQDLGPYARPLVTRESWSGTVELMQQMHMMAHVAFGGGVSLNKSEGVVSLPTGGHITFSQVDNQDAYAKHQGKNYTMLGIDEMGNYPPIAFRFVQLLRSNLRPPIGHRAHIHATANPKGRAHHLMVKNYVNRAPWWHPWLEDPTDPGSAYWVGCASTLESNPHIDRAAYRRQLLAATGNDHFLAKAWLENSWEGGGGVMFDLFDAGKHIRIPPQHLRMRHVVGADWGVAAPAVAVAIGQVLDYAAGGLRPGDCFCLMETDTVADRHDLSLGNGSPPSVFAEQIKGMLERIGAKPSSEVICDDARGLNANETVVGILCEEGLWATKPRGKNRVGGFNLVRQMLNNALTGEGPALWLTPDCPYLLETLPAAPRAPLRPEDIDPKYAEDHAIDALVYGIVAMYGGPGAANGTTTGYY